MPNLDFIDDKIIEYIIANDKCKQSSVSRQFNIDKGNLSRKCKQYKETGLLKMETLLQVNPEFNKYLILEIKHTKVLAFITDIFGTKISDVQSYKFCNMQSLYSTLQEIFKLNEHTDYDAIGCVIHGQLQNGIINHISTTSIRDFPISSYLSTLTDKNVYIENFANVAALSNYLVGSKKKHSLFYLRTSPALGAGLIYHSEIFHGFSGAAMEPGWMLLSHSSNDFYNDFFMNLEANFNQDDHNPDDSIDTYIKHLNQIVSNVSSILDPEMFVIESSVLKKHPHLLYSLNHSNITLPKISIDDSYKSICKLIFRGQTGVDYTTLPIAT